MELADVCDSLLLLPTVSLSCTAVASGAPRDDASLDVGKATMKPDQKNY